MTDPASGAENEGSSDLRFLPKLKFVSKRDGGPVSHGATPRVVSDRKVPSCSEVSRGATRPRPAGIVSGCLATLRDLPRLKFVSKYL